MLGIPERFTYLPWLAGTLLLGITSIVVSIRAWHRKNAAEGLTEEQTAENSLLMNSVMYSGISNAEGSTGILPTASGLAKRQEEQRNALYILKPVQLSDTFSSYGAKTTVLLLFWRLAALGYFVVVGCVINEEVHHTWGYQFFTTWNLWLICVFNFFAVISSTIGFLAYTSDSSSGSGSDGGMPMTGPWAGRLAQLVFVLYEITASAAFLVSVVAFTLLDPPPKTWAFWNMTIHVFNLCSMLVETALNRMEVVQVHCIFLILWCCAYIVYIWVMVVSGYVTDWPYTFLETEKWQCFLWYPALVGAGLLFYYLFQKLSAWKMHLHNNYLQSHALHEEIKSSDNFYHSAGAGARAGGQPVGMA